MLRGSCLCYFNTNEFRISFSGDVLNSAPSVNSTSVLPKQTRMPGQRKKTKALPSSSHRLVPSFIPALSSFRPWYPGVCSVSTDNLGKQFHRRAASCHAHTGSAGVPAPCSIGSPSEMGENGGDAAQAVSLGTWRGWRSFPSEHLDI